MKKIWEFIIADVQSVHPVVWVVVAVVGLLMIATIIYQQSQRPKIIIQDDDYIDNESEIVSPENDTKAWLFIDICSICTITPMSYLYLIKHQTFSDILMIKIAVSFAVSFLLYIVLVKPILFNTKQK